jgi:lysozyme
VLAKVEVHHDSTASNPIPHDHPGVTLYQSDAAPPEVVPTHETLPEGIDVNGQDVDWSQVMTSGRSFAFIKATEGVTWTSGRMVQHFDGAGGVGFKRGAYHYFRARDGAEQVDHFLSTIDGHDWELPPVLDIEVADGQLLSVVADRIAACIEAMPKDFLVYTMPGFWNGLPLEVAQLGEARLWVATWGPRWLACKNLPSPVIWQYSATASVPGFQGHADVNRVLDLDWWNTL